MPNNLPSRPCAGSPSQYLTQDNASVFAVGYCAVSGDWFNRVDWTMQHNNFGVGLPPASKNQHSWPFKRPLLAAADRYRPTPDMIARQATYFKALLRVRQADDWLPVVIKHLLLAYGACMLKACLARAGGTRGDLAYGVGQDRSIWHLSMLCMKKE